MVICKFKTEEREEGKGIFFEKLNLKGTKTEVLLDLVNISEHFIKVIPKKFLEEAGFSEKEIDDELFNLKMNLLMGLSDGYIGTIDLNEFMKEMEKEEE